jgi:hypothetical protein
LNELLNKKKIEKIFKIFISYFFFTYNDEEDFNKFKDLFEKNYKLFNKIDVNNILLNFISNYNKSIEDNDDDAKENNNNENDVNVKENNNNKNNENENDNNNNEINIEKENNDNNKKIEKNKKKI